MNGSKGGLKMLSSQVLLQSCFDSSKVIDSFTKRVSIDDYCA